MLTSIERLEDLRENALLLGMVFSTEECPKRGQEYRDRVRCEAMEKIGYNVRSLCYFMLLCLSIIFLPWILRCVLLFH